MSFLFLQKDLTGLEVVSALIMFLLVLALCGVLVLGLRWPQALRRLLHGIQQLVNRVGRWVKRPYLLPETWAEKCQRLHRRSAGHRQSSATPGQINWTGLVNSQHPCACVVSPFSRLSSGCFSRGAAPRLHHQRLVHDCLADA
ncbi:MAG: hypothetical protein R3E31_25885 [Chloroflexota bacterium]